jgi:hypothetical protein
MKKVILSVAIAFTAISGAFAQKQEGGEKNLEVNFAPLGGSPIGMDGIRLRLFNADGTGAVRVRIGLGGTNDVTVRAQSMTVANTAKTVIPELYDTKKSFNFSIRPGYEIHFEGTDRLSPYVGAELLFATGSETLIKEFHGASTTADNNLEAAAKWSTWEAERKRGTTTFGLNAVAGFDYYFVDNLYLGAEIGFGFQTKKHKDQEITVSNDHYLYSAAAQADEDFDYAGVEDGKVVIKTPVGDGTGKFKNGGWGPNYQATIRLGWLF